MTPGFPEQFLVCLFCFVTDKKNDYNNNIGRLYVLCVLI